jgi:hypothetical protein
MHAFMHYKISKYFKITGLRLGRKRARLRDSGVLIIPALQRDRVKIISGYILIINKNKITKFIEKEKFK